MEVLFLFSYFKYLLISSKIIKLNCLNFFISEQLTTRPCMALSRCSLPAWAMISGLIFMHAARGYHVKDSSHIYSLNCAIKDDKNNAGLPATQLLSAI